MISGNLSGINFAGLATGIDTESIIQKLTELQARPMQRLMVRKSQLQSRMSAFDQFRGLVNNLASAAGALSVNSAFNAVRGTSSDPQVATITSSTEALPGTYELRVSKLAQAHKIVSGAHASATAELGVNGQFMVNGKVITLQSTDTLQTVAQKINAAGAGVTASILNTDNGVYLTLTANETGKNSKIQLADVGGWQVLAPTLKLVTYDEFIRNQQGNAALSDRFRDSGQTTGAGVRDEQPAPAAQFRLTGRASLSTLRPIPSPRWWAKSTARARASQPPSSARPKTAQPTTASKSTAGAVSLPS
jgi:hypothetical protein